MVRATVWAVRSWTKWLRGHAAGVWLSSERWPVCKQDKEGPWKHLSKFLKLRAVLNRVIYLTCAGWLGSVRSCFHKFYLMVSFCKAYLQQQPLWHEQAHQQCYVYTGCLIQSSFLFFANTKNIQGNSKSLWCNYVARKWISVYVYINNDNIN